MISDLLFPVTCLGCGREGKWLCEECFEKLEFSTQQVCLECKAKNEFGRFCPNCSAKFALQGILIAADYNNKIISALVKNLKYHFAQDIAEMLGNFLIAFLKNEENKNFSNFLKNSIIIPVPLHKKRFRWREFNQAEEIAKIVTKHFNLPITTDLVRIKNTKPQVKLNAAERKTNLKNCFTWTGNNLNGKNILIIDDVSTTGSTLNECAHALKPAGAGQIWGLVVANG